MAVRKAGKQARREKRTVSSGAGTSSGYIRQEGDPDWMGQFSEEQISIQGGREALMMRAASKADASNYSDPFGKAAAQESTISTETPSETSDGPTTPPTTYGVGQTMPLPGRPSEAKGKPGKAAKSKKLLKRVSRTTGTSMGEARGIMRKARKQVRTGNRKAAKRTITRALSGGPKAGVKSSPARSKKAAAAATKITKRIATRQAGTAPKRRKK